MLCFLISTFLIYACFFSECAAGKLEHGAEKQRTDGISRRHNKQKYNRLGGKHPRIRKVKGVGNRMFKSAKNEGGNTKQNGNGIFVFLKNIHAYVNQNSAQNSVGKHTRKRLCKLCGNNAPNRTDGSL